MSEKTTIFATEDWWDRNGSFASLHKINPIRLGFIKAEVCRHFRLNPQSPKPLAGLSLLDLGCGGGLIAEPMARLGARVTGVDEEPAAIKVAKAHCLREGLEITYQTKMPPNLPPNRHSPNRNGKGGSVANANNQAAGFDVILALEVIEHTEDPAGFVERLASLLKPNGIAVFSTINRSLRAFGLAIVVGEYVARILPRGTHSFDKLVTPKELAAMATRTGLGKFNFCGMPYHIAKRKFYLSPSKLAVNYFMSAVKLRS